jgi:hypothetical protein
MTVNIHRSRDALPHPSFANGPVARMERSEIRGRSTSLNAAPGLRCASSGLRRKKEAERRQAHSPSSAPAGAARVQRDALACRRSTTALAAANQRHSSAPATRFLGRGRGARSRWFERPCAWQRIHASLAGVTRSFLSQSSDMSRRPVIMPAGRIRQSRPGAEVTSPHPRAPFPLRQPASPAGVLQVSEILCIVAKTVTNVKRAMLYLTDPYFRDIIDSNEGKRCHG